MKQNVTVIFCLFLKKQEKKITEKVKKVPYFQKIPREIVQCKVFHLPPE